MVAECESGVSGGTGCRRECRGVSTSVGEKRGSVARGPRLTARSKVRQTTQQIIAFSMLRDYLLRGLGGGSARREPGGGKQSCGHG